MRQSSARVSHSARGVSEKLLRTRLTITVTATSDSDLRSSALIFRLKRILQNCSVSFQKQPVAACLILASHYQLPAPGNNVGNNEFIQVPLRQSPAVVEYLLMHREIFQLPLVKHPLRRRMLKFRHHVIDDLPAGEVEERLHEALPWRNVAVVIRIGKGNREQFRFSAAFHNGTNSPDKIVQAIVNHHGSVCGVLDDG